MRGKPAYRRMCKSTGIKITLGDQQHHYCYPFYLFISLLLLLLLL